MLTVLYMIFLALGAWIAAIVTSAILVTKPKHGLLWVILWLVAWCSVLVVLNDAYFV